MSDAHGERKRVMISAPYMLPVLPRFEPLFVERGVELVLPPVNERLSESELLPLMGDIDGVICGDDQFTAAVIERGAPRLRVISKWGTGIDSIDQSAAERLSVAVCNTPDAFSEPVGDTVLGYALTFARHLHKMDAAMRSGEWKKPQSRTLGECCFGVVGFGDAGHAVVRRLTAFAATVLVNDIRDLDETELNESGVTSVPLDELLSRADFVTLHCDLNPTSLGLIGEEQLRAMQSHAFLINTSRGPVVDEAQLVRALQQGWIAGAALDVFEEEPLPADSPLLTMDNVLLAPHNANSGISAAERVHQNTIENLFRCLGLD